MVINEVNEAYKTGKEHERERILVLIKTWESTNFGNIDTRVNEFQKLKDKISGDNE